MNSACCKSTMSVVGVRAAALGSRGLLLCHRQCRLIMGTNGSPSPLSARTAFPHLHWLGAARPPQRRSLPSSLLLAQCSAQDPFPPAATYVLLDTKECADGSLMFNFGSREQLQSSKEVSNGVSKDETKSSDSAEVRSFVNGGCSKNAVENFVVSTGALSGPEGVPDSETLGDIARGTDAFAQELNVKEDEEKGDRIEERQLQPETIDKAGVRSMASSNVATPTDNSGSDSSSVGTSEDKPDYDVMFHSAAAMIPHPNKAKTGGEDAYFIDGTRWVGVADGVGGWALSGVNAGHYARELMWNCAERAHKVGNTSDPKSVLVYAAGRTKSQGTAATLIASLYGQTLRVANIGDSGFVVVRDSSVVAKSVPMVRGFNFPYQIGTEGDDPALAEVYEVQVQKNDVVILGSDGVWDNLFEEQIIEIVSSVQRAGGGPEVVAKQLVVRANQMGQRREGMTPFAREAHKAGFDSFIGGKLDDTTAVVSYVT